MVSRVSYTRDNVAGAEPFCDKAAEHVYFIAFGRGYEHIRFVGFGVEQYLNVRAVPLDPDNIERITAGAQDIFIFVNDNDVVFFPDKLLGYVVSDLSDAYNQNSH